MTRRRTQGKLRKITQKDRDKKEERNKRRKRAEKLAARARGKRLPDASS